MHAGSSRWLIARHFGPDMVLSSFSELFTFGVEPHTHFRKRGTSYFHVTLFVLPEGPRSMANFLHSVARREALTIHASRWCILSFRGSKCPRIGLAGHVDSGLTESGKRSRYVCMYIHTNSPRALGHVSQATVCTLQITAMHALGATIRNGETFERATPE